jgi:hypothetical protein
MNTFEFREELIELAFISMNTFEFREELIGIELAFNYSEISTRALSCEFSVQKGPRRFLISDCVVALSVFFAASSPIPQCFARISGVITKRCSNVVNLLLCKTVLFPQDKARHP